MQIANVTTQGQVSIPVKIRRKLKLDKKKKVFITEEEGKIVMEPVKDFLELGGSLKTTKKVSPREIREAFGNYLAKEAIKGMTKNALKKLGFRQAGPNIFAPSKIKSAHKRHN